MIAAAVVCKCVCGSVTVSTYSCKFSATLDSLSRYYKREGKRMSSEMHCQAINVKQCLQNESVHEETAAAAVVELRT